MTEMVISIAILGVLAGIMMMSLGGSLSASKETLAVTRVEKLNSALHQWSMSYPEMYFPVNDGGVTDELIVLRDLQYRNPNEKKATTGSPYMPPQYNPKDSSSDEDFRIRWNGRSFELLRPGQAGNGLLMVFDGSDMTEPVKFDEDYKPGSF